MAVLITGGSGFIGTMLTRDLVERGREVIIFNTQAPQIPVFHSGLYQKGDI